MRFADLHIHTIFSDSTNTISEIISLTKREGICCISITDHDTVEGIEQTIKEAEGFDIEVIPGVELTTEFEGIEIHILGYFIDYKNKYLLEKLDEIKRIRIKRIYEMTEKLRLKGVDINPESIIQFSKGGVVTRLHLAKKILESGYVKNILEAFTKYIGNNAPCYVSKFRFSPKEVISLILKIGGIPVLAHPKNLGTDNWIPKLCEFGLKGIEVIYPEYSSQEIIYYKGLARKYGLLITGGSDCHGTYKNGPLIGKIKLPYRYVEKLKEERESIFGR